MLKTCFFTNTYIKQSCIRLLSISCPKITDPFLVYQENVRNGTLNTDIEQMRAAKEFQKLYFRLKDYEPDAKALQIDTLVRELRRACNSQESVKKKEDEFAKKTSKNWNIVTFVSGLYHKDVQRKKEDECKQLIKVLSDEEALENIPVPQGLLINGEVGTGKSMLMNMFSESLPVRRKLRVHYSSFILWIFKEINRISGQNVLMKGQNELILFEIASNLVQTSYILMLDEFMMPDLAAARVIKIIFTYFFRLGGVLVATSNRLPSNMYTGGFNSAQFGQFERILKMRCVIFDMDSGNDHLLDSLSTESSFFIVKKNDPDQTKWKNTLFQLVGPGKWESTYFYSFGRQINLDQCKDNLVLLDFSHLCSGNEFGPGDFISIASRFQTVVLDNVPALRSGQKNEARKLIEFVDATYEAGCRLVMRSDVDIEHIFFNTSNTGGKCTGFKCTPIEGDNISAVEDSEMATQTILDTLNPPRPNATSYDEMNGAVFDVETDDISKSSIEKAETGLVGDDEMFAYRRTVSRLKEMLFSSKWGSQKRWNPIDVKSRVWERMNG